MMPVEIDAVRTDRYWLAFYKPNEAQLHWAHVDDVRRALHNTQVGESDAAPFYGMFVDESDCKAMLSAMGLQS